MKTVNLKRFMSLLLMAFFICGEAIAQIINVTGVVKDENGEPVIGARVVVKGTTKRAVTNINGKFSLKANANAILVISSLGHKSADVKASSQPIVVTLKQGSKLLDEVVVLGYGAAQKKQDLSASVGILKNTDELTARPVSSTEGMLQGQLAGVTVSSNGGDPTRVPNVVIRGQGSQNGDNVLWVVDGVPGAPIPSMSDIKSIVVLKDAASAAIYGAQSGAGGVILVTTKTAEKGAPSVTYEGVFGLRKASNLPQGLNAEQELAMRHQSFTNAGMSIPDGWNVEKNPWIATTRTNWMDQIFRTAFYQRHSVAFNTGTDNSSHRLSFNANDDNGVLLKTFNRTYDIRYNGNYTLNKYISVSEDLVVRHNSKRTKSTTDAYTGPILSAIYMPASATVYNPITGGYAGTTTEDPAYIKKYGSNFAGAHGDAVNPVRLLASDNMFNKTSDVWSTTSFKLRNLVFGLNFTSRFTYHLGHFNYQKFRYRQLEPGKPNNSNALDILQHTTNAWNVENTLTYDRTFDKHTIGALVSTTADHFKQRQLNVNGSQFADESVYLQYLSFAESTEANNYMVGPDANVSVVSRLAYSYDDRYFATASYRRDYAGRLPKDKNYGDFPAATIGWKISNEKFFPQTDVISFMKLRASWGKVGNLGSIYMNYSTPLLGHKFWSEQAVYGVENNALYNYFVFNSTAVNNDLTWETSEQWDWGLDISMFKNRLSLSLDYFEKETNNLIQEQTMNWPGTIGLSPMLVNQGQVRNRGIEVSASWNDKIGKDISYYISGNFSTLKNWVSDIGVKNADGTPGVWTNSHSKFRQIPWTMQTGEGQPLGSFYLIKTAGIFQSEAEVQAYKKDGQLIQPDAEPGDLKFVDYNNDGRIDTNDRQYMGSAIPKLTYSLSMGMTWKNLSISGMIQGVGGAKAFYAAKYMTQSDVEGNFNRSTEILDAWTPQNTSSTIPRLSKNDPNENFTTPSDWYLESASYLRLKNLTIAYDLTSIIQKNTYFKKRNSKLSLYLSGENLFTITPYSGMDPECGGWDEMKYPVSRIYSLGIKLTY